MKTEVRRFLLAAIPAAVTFVLILIFLVRIVNYTPRYPIYRFDDHWDITYRGSKLHDASLDNLDVLIPGDIMRNDCIILEHTLDPDSPAFETLPSPTLSLVINHYALEVLVDGVRIGDCAMDLYLSGGYVGGNRYYISLPASWDKAEKITLRYFAAEHLTSPEIYAFHLGSFHDLFFLSMQEYGYVLIIGVFLLLFGGFFLLFSLFFSVLLPEIKGQRVSSLICILVGIWILTHYRVFALFTAGRHNMTVEYIAFFLVLPLLYLLIQQIRQTPAFYPWLMLANCGAIFLFFLLHASEIVHLHHFRMAYYGMCTFFLVLLLWMDFKDITSKQTTPLLAIQMAGPTLFCALVFIAMCLNLRIGENIEEQSLSVILMTTGPFLFAMTRFIIYIRLLIESIPQRLEFSSLNALAYTDALTGLSNRARIAGIYEQLEQSPADFCLVSMDLDGLKYVNDTFGHSEGDKLLRSFADVLVRTAPQDAIPMRTGGDEFLLIQQGAKKEDIEKFVTLLKMRFTALNDVTPRIPHAVSCGYAFRSEFENANPHYVYLQADKRMYEEKHANRARS